MKRIPRIARLLLVPVAMLLGLTRDANSQAGSLIPIPFTSVAAGVAPGGSTTACSPTVDIPNISGSHFGDGCVATQASLTTYYDVQVDPGGNLYIGENSTNHYDLRVVYNGGSILNSMLVGANVYIPNFTPVPGHVYTLGGGENTTLTSVGGIYYCGNITANGIQALDSQGNGCPAAESYFTPKGMAIDQYGNVYAANVASKNSVRVIYAGGTQVANLIKLMNPTVTTPLVGYIYQIAGGLASATVGDGGLANKAAFASPRYVAVNAHGDIYIGDGTTPSVSGGVTYVTAGNNVRMVDGVTGIITTVAGETSCALSTYSTTKGCPYGYSGDGGPATAALFNSPYVIFLDQYNNLFIGDYTNARLRVVYRGGTIGGISNPVVGNVYTYAGGGTATTSGSPAQQVAFGSLGVAGIDKAGNIYVLDPTTHRMWKFDAYTAVGTIIAGGPSSTGAAALGAHCSGTAGPVSIDKYGDGCPATQSYLAATGTVSFDNQGNFYLATTTYAYIQKFSYNNQFGSSPDGTAITSPLAFIANASATLTGESFSLQGAATTEFSDAGGDTCATTGTIAAGSVCVYNVQFKPAHAGKRTGAMQLNTASGAAVAEGLAGIGIGTGLAIDPGIQSTIGTGTTPAGVATDLIGNVYLADGKGNQVLRGVSTGTSLTPIITGLNKPSQVAVDGFGNLYVADTGNNRILETTSAGVTIASLGSGMSGPQGVAVDSVGNIYAADTGNNRIVEIQANGYQFPFVAANGLSAPTQIALDSAGDLFIVDSGNMRVAEFIGGTGIVTVPVDAGVVPAGVAVDAAGDVYVEDTSSLTVLVYPGGVAPGNTIVTGLTTPVGLAADADANLFIADSTNAGILGYRRSSGSITFPLTNLGTTTQAGLSLSDVGSANLTFSSPLTNVTGPNAGLFTASPSASNGCALGTPYSPGSGCNFTVTFAPIVGPVNASAVLGFNTNASNNATATVQLSGQGLHLTTTTTGLTISSPTGSTVYYSQSVTLTATLNPTTITTTPTGTFTFTVDGRTQGPKPLNASNQVSLTVALPVGLHTVSVTYSGDTSYTSSSASGSFTVNQAVTTTTLTATPLNNSGSLSLLFTATVSSTTATGETGTVNFYAGSVLLNSIPAVVSNGTATFTTASLTFASNVLTAVYSGNSNFTPSTSPALNTHGGDFALGSSNPIYTLPQGSIGPATITLASLFGGAGTITPSCTGLPANSVCRFLPVFPAITSGQSLTVNLSIFTDVDPNLALNEKRGKPALDHLIVLACMFPIGFALLFFRKRPLLSRLGIFIIGMALMQGLTGCGQASLQTFSTLVTPTGTYPVTITFVGSNGLTTTHTAQVTITIIPAPTN